MVARCAHNAKVAGSIPVSGTIVQGGRKVTVTCVNCGAERTAIKRADRPLPERCNPCARSRSHMGKRFLYWPEPRRPGAR